MPTARANPTDKQIPNDDIVRSWTHPRVAKGDMADEVAKLKRDDVPQLLAFGQDEPVTDDTTHEGRFKNRRIDLKNFARKHRHLRRRRRGMDIGFAIRDEPA